MSCAETDELIKIQFGMCTRVGPRNHVFKSFFEMSVEKRKKGFLKFEKT